VVAFLTGFVRITLPFSNPQLRSSFQIESLSRLGSRTGSMVQPPPQLAARTDIHIQRAQPLLQLYPGLYDAVAAVTRHYVFCFSDECCSRLSGAGQLMKYERLVLVRNGKEIALLAEPESSSSFDKKRSCGNLSSHSTV
jgi:hypothetical protein